MAKPFEAAGRRNDHANLAARAKGKPRRLCG
jgi:hypothetical protein